MKEALKKEGEWPKVRLGETPRMLLLAFYALGSSFGVQLRETVAEMTASSDRISFGSLYPSLRLLEAHGYINNQGDQFTTVGPPRIMYGLTIDGQIAAEREFEKLKAIVNYVTVAGDLSLPIPNLNE